MRKNGKRILIGAVLLAILAFLFWWGGNSPGLRGLPAGPATTPAASPIAASPTPSPTPTAETAALPSPSPDTAPSPNVAPSPETTAKICTTPAISPTPKASAAPAATPTPVKDKYLTDPVPAGKPDPVEPENVVVGNAAYTCTLSVRCDTILDHIDWLDPEKVELVPEDGIIFPEATVTFYEGESVFNALQRELKRSKIHLEFSNTPIYNSAYIEGLNNLYEFDCGELSGWMYKVNDWFPNYGCSRYQLQDGDKVEWIFTCDLGRDVGSNAGTLQAR